MKMKRFLSFLMAICVVISMLPANVFASEAEVPEESTVSVTPAPGAEALSVASVDDSAAVATSDNSYPTLVLGETVTAEISEGDNYYAYFSFVPEVTGYYTFTSNTTADTYGYLYDAGMVEIVYNDDAGVDNNFLITYCLEAGVQYYYGVRFYSNGAGSFDVLLKVSEKPQSLTLGCNSTTLFVGDSFYISPSFSPAGTGDVITLVSSDESVLKYSHAQGWGYYFDAVGEGMATVTMTTAGGLECSITVTVISEPAELTVDSEITLDTVNYHAYVNLVVEKYGVYVIRVNSTNAYYNVNGSYGSCGIYEDYENGYTYYRFRLYANSPVTLTLRNDAEEEVTYELLMKHAEIPQNITITGPTTAYSNTDESYLIDYGSGWAYTPVVWACEGAGSVSYVWDSAVSVYLSEEGTLTVTATSREIEGMSASLTINVVDAIDVNVGQDYQVDLPVGKQQRFCFSPETSGFYKITFGEELSAFSEAVYLVQEDGTTSQLHNPHGYYYFDAGCTYKLHLTNHGTSQTTTMGVFALEELPSDSSVTTSEYETVYALSVDEDGWYWVYANYFESFNGYIQIVKPEGTHFDYLVSTGEFYDENGNHCYYNVAWLEADCQYLVYIRNNNNTELTVRAEKCPIPVSLDSHPNYSVAAVGTPISCFVTMRPVYARDNYTVEILSGSAEVTEQADSYFWIKGTAEGPATVQVTLDCGLTATFDITFIEPMDLPLDSDVSVSTLPGCNAYIDLDVDTSGYYILRVNSTDSFDSISGSWEGHGKYIDQENGYVYHRFYLYEHANVMLTLHNYTEQDKNYEFLLKAAQTPETITIRGQEVGFSAAGTSRFTIDYGSVWAYTPVRWTCEGYGWVNYHTDYDASFYLEKAGTLTITATSANDENLTVSCIVNIVDSIELTVGEETEIILPSYQWNKYTFVAEASGAYSITFGDNLTNYNAYLYQLDEAGNTTSISPVNGVYHLEAGYTYRLDVRNYNADLNTTVIVEPFRAEALVLGQITTAVVPLNGCAWFSFIPESSGYYYFTSYSDRDTYGYLYDEQMTQIARNDDGNDRNFLVKYYLEAGSKYFYAARFYSNGEGSFDVSLNLCEKPTRVDLHYSNTVLLVGDRFHARPEFYPYTSGDNYTITSSDENVLRFSCVEGEYHYFEAVSEGVATITLETAGGLRRELSVKVIIPTEVPLDSAVSVTTHSGEYAYFGLNVEESGDYIVRSNVVNFDNRLSGYYEYYGFQVDQENGYTYYYLHLYAYEPAMLTLRNNREEEVTFELLMKPAQKPESISIVGPESGFSYSVTPEYVIDFGSPWAFTPIEWRCEGNGSVNNRNDCRADFALYEVGTLNVTAFSSVDESLRASLTIAILDSIALTVGEQFTYTFAAGNSVPFSFTVETSGIYSVSLGEELHDVSTELYRVDENGNRYNVSCGYGLYLLEAGQEYKLNIINHGNTATATILVDQVVFDTLDLGQTVQAHVSADNYDWFSFVPEEDGYYYFTSNADRDTYGYLFDAEFHCLQANDDGGESNNFLIRYILEAGKQYYFAAAYYSASDTGTFDVVLDHCPKPTSVTLDRNANYVLKGDVVWVRPSFYPSYSADLFTITSSDESILKFACVEGDYYYFEGVAEGSAELIVTTAEGITSSVLIHVIEPTEVTVNEELVAVVPENRPGYFIPVVEARGLYVLRVNSEYAHMDYSGAIEYYGKFVDEENGYTYFRVELWEEYPCTLQIYGNTHENVDLQLLLKPAETPTSISIIGPDYAFAQADQPYRVAYNSCWAFTNIDWSVDGDCHVNSYGNNGQFVSVYFRSLGTATLTVCSQDGALSDSLSINIMDAIDASVDEVLRVSLDVGEQMRYNFTPERTGFYAIEFGEGGYLERELFEADTGNWVSNNWQGFWLEAGTTYQLRVTNNNDVLTTTSVKILSPVDMTLDTQYTVDNDYVDTEVYAFTPVEAGWYMLVTNSYLYGGLFRYDSFGGVSFSRCQTESRSYQLAYLEAGVTYYNMIYGYSGSLTIAKCPEPEAIYLHTENEYLVTGGIDDYYNGIRTIFYPVYSRCDISWNVSDESLVTIGEHNDEYLHLFAEATGQITVTAETASGLKASVDLKLLKPKTYNLTMGQTRTITVKPDRAIVLNVQGSGPCVLSHENSLLAYPVDCSWSNTVQGMKCIYWDRMYDESVQYLLINDTDETVTIDFTLESIPEATDVTFSQTDVSIQLFDRVWLDILFTPFNALEEIQDLQISNRNVLDVIAGDEGGIELFALGVGEATITLITKSGLTATCTVTVEAPEYDAELTLDQYVGGSLEAYFDFDFYSFTAPETDAYFFAVVSEWDTMMIVCDENWVFQKEIDAYNGINPGSWLELSKGETVNLILFTPKFNAVPAYRIIVSQTNDVFYPALTIVNQPESVTVAAGEMATVTVDAVGKDLTYAWYWAPAGSDDFTLTKAFTGNRYYVEMNSTREGRKVYCVITDADGNQVTTNTVVLGMGTPLAITQQPMNVIASNGSTAAVGFEAVGEDLTYEWYWAASGSDTFALTTSFKGNTYSVEMNSSRNGRRVYCVVSDKYGNTIKTNTVTLIMGNDLEIVEDIADITVGENHTARVELQAEGDGLTYQWYWAAAGSDEFIMTTAFEENFYSVKMNASRSGRQVYCVVTDQYGRSARSNIATLNMATIEIQTQPQNVMVPKGDSAIVTVDAIGEGLTYAWYYSDDGGKTFKLTTTFTGNSYNITMTEKRSGRQVYCVISDSYGNSVETDVVTLLIRSGVTITKQPVDVTVKNKAKATVTVEAIGEGLTYKWYYSDNGGKTFTRTKSFTGNSYSITMSQARAGRQVYCKITDAEGNTVKTDVVTLGMTGCLKILAQPESVTVASGKKASVTVNVFGEGLTYTWYFSDNNGESFKSTSTFDGDTYYIKMTSARAGRQVYCVITDAHGNTVTTDVVTLGMK